MKNRNYTVIIQSLLVAITGVILAIQPVAHFITQHMHHSALHLPVPTPLSSQLIATVIGICLLYFVFYLHQRHEVAYFATILLLAGAVVTQLVSHRVPLTAGLLTTTLIWLVATRRRYTVKSDLVRLAGGVRIALTIGAVGYAYGIIGFLSLGPIGFHSHFSLGQSAFLSFQTLLTFHDIDTPTRLAETFIQSLNVIGVLLIILITSSLFKPVRFVLNPHHADKQKILKILQQTSVSSEDYFKVWPNDKHYFFSQSDASFLTYKTSGRTAIILGDPSGVPTEFDELLTQFTTFITSNGWIIAAINSTDISSPLYEQHGLKKLFIGNEAILSIPDFITKTSRSKHFRYVYNRAKRDGLSVEQWDDLSSDQITTLRRVSDSWLSRNGRKEYTFFMGYFDANYLKNSHVMVLRQAGEVMAYINLIPSFVESESSIDHLRSATGASPAAMHYLLGETITMLHAQSKQLLNLGFAPLSGIEQRDTQRVVIEQVLRVIKKLGNRYYSFQGVEQFKDKFQPDWQSRYLYYSGPLATVIQNVERASQLSSQLSKRRAVIGTALVIIILFGIIQFI